jgi:hypothetical protein
MNQDKELRMMNKKNFSKYVLWIRYHVDRISILESRLTTHPPESRQLPAVNDMLFAIPPE